MGNRLTILEKLECLMMAIKTVFFHKKFMLWWFVWCLFVTIWFLKFGLIVIPVVIFGYIMGKIEPEVVPRRRRGR